MIENPGITCIIPFWNEGENLFMVLNEMKKVRNVSEIICIDDGSDDENFKILKSSYPEIKSLRLKKNRGKTGAIREGLKCAKGDFVLLLDADLRNLNSAEIERAVKAFNLAENLDMLILRRINASFFVRLYRADVLFSGERLMRRSDLETIIDTLSVQGWQLESAINNWMHTNGKVVAWMAHSGINKQKYIKWGFINGVRLDLKTYSDMISATGFNNLVKQILFFAKQEFRPLPAIRKNVKPVSVVETV
ncbi:MAG TPA: glycosyltransferase family 2 protein [Bacteroidales bacterium]|nr:glycosyltransferase family 2 protein [Bacteroidales bacterium]